MAKKKVLLDLFCKAGGATRGYQLAGDFSDVAYARLAMGIDWMTRDELSQAIPPAFTDYIGAQLMRIFQ